MVGKGLIAAGTGHRGSRAFSLPLPAVSFQSMVMWRGVCWVPRGREGQTVTCQLFSGELTASDREEPRLAVSSSLLGWQVTLSY
jgi:hypothetical protein